VVDEMSIQNKSILIIDDDPSILRALAKVLRGEGASVICAEWAGDAIDILTHRQARIDLVITDLQMPLMTGMTVVYAVHQIFPAMSVIVLTAVGNPELRAACLREGAAAFLEKPLDTPQLLATLESVLGTPPAIATPLSQTSKPRGAATNTFHTK